MTLDEVACYLEGIDNRERESWEQTRAVFFAVVQSNSTKKINIEKIFPLSWDKKTPKKEVVTDTKEAREKLRKKALSINNTQ